MNGLTDLGVLALVAYVAVKESFALVKRNSDKRNPSSAETLLRDAILPCLARVEKKLDEISKAIARGGRVP